MKKLLALSLSVGVFFGSIQSKRSEALVGAVVAFANPAAGLSIAAVGGGSLLLSSMFSRLEAAPLGAVMAALLFGVVGGVLLDEEGMAEFQPIKREEAEKLTISLDEMNAYNDELEEINLLHQNISLKVNQKLERHEKIENVFEEAHIEWKSFEEMGYISHEAYEALKKISSNLK